MEWQPILETFVASGVGAFMGGVGAILVGRRLGREDAERRAQIEVATAEYIIGTFSLERSQEGVRRTEGTLRTKGARKLRGLGVKLDLQQGEDQS